MRQSNLERLFITTWRQVFPQRPEPEAEYRFCDNRRYRFDFAWVDSRVAVELQGGTWLQGAHSRGLGQTRDCEKHNIATQFGWRVLYFTSDMLRKDPVGCLDDVLNVLVIK